MIFYILITIVFIAELIIALTIFYWLYRSSKFCREADDFITLAKPKIKEIARLCTGLSEQLLEFAPILIEKIKRILWDFAAGQLKSVVAGVTFWAVKTEVEKHISK